MTAFSPADLPTTTPIDTIEALVVWGISILEALNKDDVFLSGAGSERVIEGGAYPIASGNNPKEYRYIVRCAMPLTGLHIQGDKVWETAQEIASDPIPARFTA